MQGVRRSRAATNVNDCIAVMQQICDNETFDNIFETATAVYREDIVMPLLTARQKNRTNVPANNAQD